MCSPIALTILTVRGHMILTRLGNYSPGFSQIKFAQTLVSLICDGNESNSKKLDDLLSKNTLSREELQMENKYQRFMAAQKLLRVRKK